MMASSAGPRTDTPKIRGPVCWDIVGKENYWNWTVRKSPLALPDPDAEIDYQTHFPNDHTAMLYKGAHALATLLATIHKTKDESLEITIPRSTGDKTITMHNTSGESFHELWPIVVESLDGRELHWEQHSPVEGNDDLKLIDPATGEVLAHANDDYLSLHKEMPEDVIEELVVTATAAHFVLVDVHGHMGIAAQGPENRSQWKYQDPYYEEPEEGARA